MAEKTGRASLSVVCLSLSSKLRIKSSLGPYPCNSPKVVLSFHFALVRGGGRSIHLEKVVGEVGGMY